MSASMMLPSWLYLINLIVNMVLPHWLVSWLVDLPFEVLASLENLVFYAFGKLISPYREPQPPALIALNPADFQGFAEYSVCLALSDSVTLLDLGVAEIVMHYRGLAVFAGSRGYDELE